MLVWRTEYKCFYCGTIISDSERMYSSGRCPYCGSKHPDACTIVHTTERAYYNERIGLWWQLWKYKRVYMKIKGI